MKIINVAFTKTFNILKIFTMKFLNFTVQTFGFTNCGEFLASMTNKGLFPVILSISALTTFIAIKLGIQEYTVVAIAIALGTELVTGLWASVLVKREKPESEKFARFGLKAFVWFVFVYVAHTLDLQYKGHWMGFFWDNVHTYLVTYITLHYLISIDENMATIFKKDKNQTVLKRILNQVYKLLPTSKIENDENKDSKNSVNL